MRHIATFKTLKGAREFYLFLASKGIEPYLEQEDELGVWVKNEDEVARARELYQAYTVGSQVEEPVGGERGGEKVREHAYEALLPKSGAFLTKLCIALCTFVYLLSGYQQMTTPNQDQILFKIRVFTTAESLLLYDYPPALALVKKLQALLDQEGKKGDEKVQSPEAQKLEDQIKENPIWSGWVHALLYPDSKEAKAPLFTSIRQGEVWRAITPIFLHANLVHILFNMLWLWALGKMVEENLNTLRTLVFILIVALVTNCLQYLATGPFFMGFSGVIAAFGGYIWERKRCAPWEVYPIDPFALTILWIFIFGFLALQIIAFFLEMFHIVSFEMPIANTAHVAGVLLGVSFAHIKFFQRNR